MVTQKSNQLFDQVFEGLSTQETLDLIPSPIFLKDKEGVYFCTNQAAKNLSKIEMDGKTDFEMPWKDEAKTFRANDKHVMETKITHTFIEEVVLDNEQTIRYSTVKAPLFDKSGNVIGIIGVPNQITDV